MLKAKYSSFATFLFTSNRFLPSSFYKRSRKSYYSTDFKIGLLLFHFHSFRFDLIGRIDSLKSIVYSCYFGKFFNGAFFFYSFISNLSPFLSISLSIFYAIKSHRLLFLKNSPLSIQSPFLSIRPSSFSKILSLNDPRIFLSSILPTHLPLPSIHPTDQPLFPVAFPRNFQRADDSQIPPRCESRFLSHEAPPTFNSADPRHTYDNIVIIGIASRNG